jgi:hypothetical protein
LKWTLIKLNQDNKHIHYCLFQQMKWLYVIRKLTSHVLRDNDLFYSVILFLFLDHLTVGLTEGESTFWDYFYNNWDVSPQWTIANSYYSWWNIYIDFVRFLPSKNHYLWSFLCSAILNENISCLKISFIISQLVLILSKPRKFLPDLQLSRLTTRPSVFHLSYTCHTYLSYLPVLHNCPTYLSYLPVLPTCPTLFNPLDFNLTMYCHTKSYELSK